MKKYIIYLLFFSFLQGYGQWVSPPPPSYAQMVRNIFGPGVKVSNIIVKGDTVLGANNSVSLGWFNGANAGIGLSQGLVMTTGNITFAQGPNMIGNQGIQWAANPIPGTNDTHLDALLQAKYNYNAPNAFYYITAEASSIQFDIIPYWDTINIRYVFASDEYPFSNYSNGCFNNDAFACFVMTGNKPSGGSYNIENMALAPNPANQMPICINSIHQVTLPQGIPTFNSTNYFSNPDTSTNTSPIGYDGYTQPLIIKIPVKPCEMYRIKLVIADVHSYSTDSGVFLEAGAVSSIPTNTAAYNLQRINNVLSINGGTYSQVHISDFRNGSASLPTDTTIRAFYRQNAYEKGELGIWQPDKNYTYLKNRKQSLLSGTVNTPNIRTSGVMDSVILWNPMRPRLPIFHDAWKKTQEITQYNPYGQELENKDVLGIYSSALYGFGGKLAIAVAGNAKQDEVGFESFEEYAPAQVLNQMNNSSGNLDLVPTNVADYYQKLTPLNVIKGKGNIAQVELRFDVNTMPQWVGQKVRVVAYSEEDATGLPYEEALGDFTIECIYNYDSTNLYSKWVLSPCAPGFAQSNSQRFWTGKIYRIGSNTVTPTNNTTKVSFVKDTAHTGNMSMKVKSTVVMLKQHALKLIPGKNYRLSAWVRFAAMDNYAADVITHSPIRISAGKNNTNIANVSFIAYKSDIIDGWQQVEMAFTFPASILPNLPKEDLYITFQPVNAAGTAPGTLPIYIDDVKIQPEEAEMKCYIYNPINYRLEATLDENHFSTFYQYDDEGNLRGVRKETEDGIKTLQSIQSHIQE